MAFNPTDPVSVGEATKADDYHRVFDNTLALRAGEIATSGQAADDFMRASSATQLVPMSAAQMKIWVETFT